MRRTASLDAIYLRVQWPKDTSPSHSSSSFSLSSFDKSTQTPEEWAALSLSEVNCCDDSPVSSSSSSSSCNSIISSTRRPSNSLPSSPWPPVHPPSPISGEQIDRIIRQRLQRTNKEAVSSARYSPVHGDHSVLASVPVSRQQSHNLSSGMSRSGQIPQIPKPLLPRFRGSVEGLNQEIEKLVLKPTLRSEDSEDGKCERSRDGRRAPIADYFRSTRSVNTQTPARGGKGGPPSAASSTHTSPSSVSPCLSPPPVHGSITPPDSPLYLGTPIATSPRLNKFLAREPPDGCEKVALKPSEIRAAHDSGMVLKPCVQFILKPSLCSAFCPLEKPPKPDCNRLMSRGEIEAGVPKADEEAVFGVDEP